MDEDLLEATPDTSNEFENCAKPQAVVKCEFAVDCSSDDSPLGTFILSAVEIFIVNDSEVE